MAVDLFGIALGSVVSWGVGKALDAAVKCFCGSPRQTVVDNVSFNRHSCSLCGRALEQFTNATVHTVNRNKSVVSAHVSNVTWPSWSGVLPISFDLDAVDTRFEDLVVEVILSQFRGSEFAHNTMVFKPQCERTRWTSAYFNFDGAQFPLGSYTFAVDMKTYNVWGDLLHHMRTLNSFQSSAA